MPKHLALILTLLCTQFFAKAQTSLSVSFSTPTAFHVCHESDYIEIEVRSIVTSTVSGIQTQVTLPPGITYVAGSITSTNVTEKSIVDLTKPIFDIPNLTVASAATFKIKVKIACSIATYLNSGGLPRLQSTTLYTGGSVSKNSSPMSIKQPTLLISAITNQIITANKGSVFVRRFTLKNTGSGKLKNFTFRRINKSGLELINAAGGTVTHSNDTTWSYVDSAAFVTIGNSDKFFDLNEVFYLYDTLRVKECTNLSSSFKASWGCDGNTCESRFASGGVSISANNPLLVITPRSYTTNCMDISNLHNQELVISNTGVDTARDVEVNIFQSYNGGFYSLIMSKIEIGSIKYKIGNGSLQSLTPFKTRNTTTTGNFSCLGIGSKGAFDVKLPNIPNGQSITLVWQTRSCCPSSCNAYFWSQRWKFKASYKNQCGTTLNYAESWGSGGKVQSIAASKFLPTDIRDGETATLEYTFSSGYLITPIAASQLRVEVILPAGLTHSLNTSDLMFSHPNGSTWSPNRIAISNDTLTAYFRGVPTVTLIRSELKVTLLANCQSLSVNKNLSYKLNIKYNPDTTCASNCWLDIYCDQDAIKIHCATGCNAGLHFKDFEAKRTSFGQPDNNNDGVPDASGSLDFSKIKTNKVMFGDTLTAIFRAKVNNAGTITNWRFGKATSTLNWGYYLDVADVRIRIYRVGNQLFNCNNIAYTSSSSGYAKTFTFDVGYNNLSASGCALYSSFGYLNVDSIELEVKYVVSKNPGNAIRDLTMTNDFYLSSVANPSSSQKYQCDSFSSRTSLVGSFFTNFGTNTVNIDGCSPFFTYQNYYLSIGRCCGNYAGGNLFPYEYRPWAKLNGVILKKTSGFDVNYSYLTQTRTKGTAAVATQKIDTIRPYNIGLTQLDFNTDSFYQDKGGPLLISDDGFYGTFATNFTPNCRARTGTSLVEYGFIFERLGFLGSGLDTFYTTTQNDVVNYTKPEAIITPYNNYAYPAQDTAIWDLRIINNSSTSLISNFWLSAFQNPNMELVEV